MNTDCHQNEMDKPEEKLDVMEKLKDDMEFRSLKDKEKSKEDIVSLSPKDQEKSKDVMGSLSMKDQEKSEPSSTTEHPANSSMPVKDSSTMSRNLNTNPENHLQKQVNRSTRAVAIYPPRPRGPLILSLDAVLASFSSTSPNNNNTESISTALRNGCTSKEIAEMGKGRIRADSTALTFDEEWARATKKSNDAGVKEGA